MTPKKKDKWERLNDLMNRWHNGDKRVPYEVVEHFISTLLSEQKKELREKIEKMERPMPIFATTNYHPDIETWYKANLSNEHRVNFGYNQAIDDILKLL